MLHSTNKNFITKSGLQITDVSVCYASGESALNGIHLNVPEHQIFTLLGPSGCGKSTLLRSVAGLIQPNHGEITYNHFPLQNNHRSFIGFVPQNYGLLPWKTVQGNIMTALKISRNDLTREQQLAQSQLWLTAMGIANLANKFPLAISGGQQQRVALARTFAIQPQIMLLDEPFSALDAITREEIQRIFLENWATHPTTTLFVTHDVDEAIMLGQKIVVMPANKDDELTMIDNPVFPVAYNSKREHPLYFEQMKTIRKVMQEKW
ncbi:ATP-binding cassette domain-containing protein [Paenibacillus turicensis]|uniref:ABC transporter ATP-binding protein n=1 Tax=Paenibacillus turicensis TaxID=160487 RepID=UPI003D278B70